MSCLSPSFDGNLSKPTRSASADPVRTMEQVHAMKTLDDPSSSLHFIHTILSSLRTEIGDETALLGFVGTPWTLAAYAIEGKADRHCKQTKVRSTGAPDQALQIKGHMVQCTRRHLLAIEYAWWVNVERIVRFFQSIEWFLPMPLKGAGHVVRVSVPS
jgi:hypothetical protein